MKVRVVVANRLAARFYDVDRRTPALRFVDELKDPIAARPEERRHHTHQMDAFAGRIADALAAAHRSGQFDGLVTIAAPAFLGALRAALPKGLRALIRAEVLKDLVDEPEGAIVAHLGPNALAPMN